MVTAPTHLPRTVGELRAAGHRERGVKQEIRENLLARLAEGADGEAIWPGILGFDDTVLPQLERALIAGHDFVLLGERGQGKTRLLRALVGLLDEWTPVIGGAELGEHPYAVFDSERLPGFLLTGRPDHPPRDVDPDRLCGAGVAQQSREMPFAAGDVEHSFTRDIADELHE